MSDINPKTKGWSNYTKSICQKYSTCCIVISVLIKLILIIFAIYKYIDSPHEFQIDVSPHHTIILSIIIIFIGLIISNMASSCIVQNVKDYLWKELKKIDLEAENDWRKYNLHSPISRFIGHIERIIIVIAGLHSFEILMAVAGAWITIKIAIDWTTFVKINHRGVSHIYLISTILSILLAFIDVVAIRALLGMDFLLS